MYGTSPPHIRDLGASPSPQLGSVPICHQFSLFSPQNKYLTTYDIICSNNTGGGSMRKKYSLDFSIVRDSDRMHAVEEILDGLSTDPSPTELE